MYAEVESSGVTPYAAREKNTSCSISWIVFKELDRYDSDNFSISDSDEETIKNSVLPKILNRISKVDDSVREEAKEELLEILDLWKQRRTIPYLWSDSQPEYSLLMSAETVSIWQRKTSC